MLKKALYILFGVILLSGCSKREASVPTSDSASLANPQGGGSGSGGAGGSNGAGPSGGGSVSQAPYASRPDTQYIDLGKAAAEEATLDSMVPVPDSIQRLMKAQAARDVQNRKNASKIPVGEWPILNSTQLFAFHVPLPGFYKDTSLVFKRDVPKVISKSVQVYRDVNDPNHTIRATIIDQNEKAASQIIKDLAALRTAGGEETRFSPDGDPITAYLVEINGMLGSCSYIEKRHRAVLNLICGDHRIIQLIEEPATGRDHVVELAKHYDVKKFEKM